MLIILPQMGYRGCLRMILLHRFSCNRLLVALALTAALFLYCEYLMYYVVLLQCSWPELNKQDEDLSIVDAGKPLRMMLFADPHLLGTREGHWFDKLRREWQMQRSFQSSTVIHSPDVVFVLGDLFDEGKWSNDAEFSDYVKRFQHIFRHSASTQMHVVVGNHDIGFHYVIETHKRKRFSRAFDAPSVRLLRIHDNTFVLVNSMAFEGDRCVLCREADLQLAKITKQLHCAQFKESDCDAFEKFKYTKPILLQHFPLYRPSDGNCTGPDAPPPSIRYTKFRPKFDCLSQEATEKLLSDLQPRLVIDAHTHHGCFTLHKKKIPEWTIASFSWRNRVNPTFILAVITNNNYALRTCFLPREDTLIYTYITGVIIIILWFIYPQLKLLLTMGSRYRKIL